jgi:hypothetical protein
MSRFVNCALAAVAASVMFACSDATGPRSAQVNNNQMVLRASGGSGSGGGTVKPPTVVPPACSMLSLTPRSGYTPQSFSYAAIWINVKFKNCGTTPITVQGGLNLDLTGQPAGSSTLGTVLLPMMVPYVDSVNQPWVGLPGDSLMITVDADFQMYSTSYTSTVNLRDYNTGALLATCSAISITPKARNGIGSGGNSGSSDTACYSQ